MLTDNEEILLENITNLIKGFRQIQADASYNWNVEKYDGDFTELTHHIHALQNWVLANAAARDNTEYRFFGCKPRQA
jgi:hypothetical protein